MGLKAYCEKELGQTEECLFSGFDEGFSRGLLNRQLRSTQYLKQRGAHGGPKQTMGVCMVIDAFIEMPPVLRKANGCLSSIATRRQRGSATCFHMTQKYEAQGTEIRTILDALMQFRQRSRFDLEAFLTEKVCYDCKGPPVSDERESY